MNFYEFYWSSTSSFFEAFWPSFYLVYCGKRLIYHYPSAFEQCVLYQTVYFIYSVVTSKSSAKNKYVKQKVWVVRCAAYGCEFVTERT